MLIEQKPLGNAPIKKYPNGSTGGYHVPCGCGQWFIGHKRDPLCPDCDRKVPKQLELPT